MWWRKKITIKWELTQLRENRLPGTDAEKWAIAQFDSVEFGRLGNAANFNINKNLAEFMFGPDIVQHFTNGDDGELSSNDCAALLVIQNLKISMAKLKVQRSNHSPVTIAATKPFTLTTLTTSAVLLGEYLAFSEAPSSIRRAVGGLLGTSIAFCFFAMFVEYLSQQSAVEYNNLLNSVDELLDKCASDSSLCTLVFTASSCGKDWLQDCDYRICKAHRAFTAKLNTLKPNIEGKVVLIQFLTSLAIVLLGVGQAIVTKHAA